MTSEPLRVALVLASSVGGIGRHVASLTRGLIGRGIEVSVCCPAATEAKFDFAGLGARVHPLEIPANPAAADLAVVSRLRRLLRGPDREAPMHVVHAHGLRAGLVAAWARPSAIPLVVTWHNAVLGTGLAGRAGRFAERLVARAAEVTLAASPDLVDRAEALGANEVRLGPVAAPALRPPTRDRDEIRAEFDAGDRPLIVSVGRLHPQKGYEVLVRTAARWRELSPPPLVLIAGTGPSYRDLAGEILAQRAPVILVGHRDDVSDLLAAADLAVVTSRWEARQLFAQEALAAGVPVVATAVGGLPSLLGDAAVLIAPGDPDALDLAVRELLADADLRAHYAEAGLRQAGQWPTEQDTIEQVLGVYNELTDRARADRAGA
ncbi:MAG TPA: glycosyltransferase family 4 protein [Micromonosporaceae bacterium]